VHAHSNHLPLLLLEDATAAAGTDNTSPEGGGPRGQRVCVGTAGGCRDCVLIAASTVRRDDLPML